MRKLSPTLRVSFGILSAVQPSADEARLLATRLREAGVDDLHVYARGAYANRIGLGLYAGPKLAEARSAGQPWIRHGSGAAAESCAHPLQLAGRGQAIADPGVAYRALIPRETCVTPRAVALKILTLCDTDGGLCGAVPLLVIWAIGARIWRADTGPWLVRFAMG